MSEIVKKTVPMWANEIELNEWFELIGTLIIPKLSTKKTKKYNVMVHVTIESPIHEER